MPYSAMETPTMLRHAPRARASLRLWARLAGAVLALAIGLAPAARAEEPLRWKFEKGETIRYVLVQKAETKMKAGEVESGSTVNQTSDLRWIVDEVSPEGVAKLTQIIDRVRVKLEVAGQPAFEFDSNDKETVHEGQFAQIVPVFKALAGFECSLAMDSRGRIDDVKISEKSLEALKGSIAGPMSNLFSEDSMKNMITQSSLILPEQAVEDGKGWTDQSKLSVPQLGTIVTDKTYTVEGADPDDASKVRINLDAKMTVEQAGAPEASLEIEEQKNEGRFAFDAGKGRIAKSHVEVRMVQLITAGANKFRQTMDNTMEMSLAPGESTAE